MKTKSRVLSISEAARELGLSAEWLRQGEKRGSLPLARRDRNGHRYYTDDDLEQLRKRRLLHRKEQGSFQEWQALLGAFWRRCPLRRVRIRDGAHEFGNPHQRLLLLPLPLQVQRKKQLYHRSGR